MSELNKSYPFKGVDVDPEQIEKLKNYYDGKEYVK